MAQSDSTLPVPLPAAARSNGRAAAPAPRAPQAGPTPLATPQVDYLPFATQAGANVVDQPTYAGSTIVPNGYTAGIAASAWLNKTWRQASVMSAALANFIANSTGQNVLDDGNVPALTLLYEQALALYLTSNPALSVRQRLTQNTILFVNFATGSDTVGTGAATAPFQTLQAAWNYAVAFIDMNGYALSISLAAGTYPGASLVGNPIGNTAGVTIAGVAGNPAQVKLTSVVTVPEGGGRTTFLYCQATDVAMQDLQLGDNSTTPAYGVFVNGGAMTLRNVLVGAAQTPFAVQNGEIGIIGTPAIVGAYSASLFYADLNATIFVGTLPPDPATSMAINVAGAASTATAYSFGNSTIQFEGRLTFSGPGLAGCTGPRYLVDMNAILTVTGPPFTLGALPGNAAGTKTRGGQDGT